MVTTNYKGIKIKAKTVKRVYEIILELMEAEKRERKNKD